MIMRNEWKRWRRKNMWPFYHVTLAFVYRNWGKLEINSVMMASTWTGYAWRPQSVNQRYSWKFCHCVPRQSLWLSVGVTNDYLASPCFSKYSWSRIHSRSHMMLSNEATSWTSLSLLPPDQVLSILSTGTCHLSSNSFMSALETSNLLPRLYLKREHSHITVQSLGTVGIQ